MNEMNLENKKILQSLHLLKKNEFLKFYVHQPFQILGTFVN